MVNKNPGLTDKYKKLIALKLLNNIENFRNQGVEIKKEWIKKENLMFKIPRKIIDQMGVCKENGIKFIGASPEMIEAMGDKSSAKQTMKDAGVDLIIRAAKNSRFNELEWWKTEEGLIAINNEWIKTLYYWWKY